MPLQQSWIEHLFAKLTVRYGAAFMRQYSDLDITLVKADWAEVLDGVKGDSLSYALRYLPEKPPNAIQMREICRRAPVPDAPALPAPVVKADPQRVAEIVAAAMQPKPQASLADVCALKIADVVASRGGRISGPQSAQLDAVYGLLSPVARRAADKAAGHPVRDDELHPALRNGALEVF